MKIYNYNEDGLYMSDELADESPLEQGVFLIPANATTISPTFEDGKLTKFDGAKWILTDIPTEKYYRKIADDSIELLTAPDENEYIVATNEEVVKWNFLEIILDGHQIWIQIF